MNRKNSIEDGRSWRQKLTGKMGQQVQVVDKINPKEFERMERGIADVDNESKELNRRRQELEDILYKGKREIQEMKKQYGKLKVEVNPLKEQVAMMERQVADQENKVKEAAPDKKIVKEMMARVAAAQENSEGDDGKG